MVVQKLQKKEYELLCIVDDICRKYGIHYSLAYGTALGAVRHQGFIPWDDIDVGMLPKDYERFLSIAPTEFQEYFFMKSIYTEKNTVYYRTNIKQCILRICYQLLPNYVRKKAIMYYMKKLCVGNEKDIVVYGSYDENIRQGLIFDKKDIQNICYMPFEEVMLPVFSGYDNILRGVYGDDYMDIPPAHKRYGHSSVYYDIHTSYQKVKYYE